MAELARVACGRYGLPADCDLHLYPLTENRRAVPAPFRLAARRVLAAVGDLG